MAGRSTRSLDSMLKLRRQRREEHTEWLRWMPELLLIPIAAVVAPGAYSVYLLIHQRWIAGIVLLLSWAGLFAVGAAWLHKHRYIHIAIAALTAVAIVGFSAFFLVQLRHAV